MKKKEDKAVNKYVYEYRGKLYPNYIQHGNAYHFCLPFAQEFCKGNGLDIGGGDFDNWTFPGARPINTSLNDNYDAHHLPKEKYDYIFSSHCLEHLDDYVSALEIWKNHLKPGGTLFLYIPHPDMEYWLPENNRKHRHIFHPEDLARTVTALGFENVLASQRDLYWAFSIVAFAPKK